MAKIRTEFTAMIDVDYPIIGAPMFLVSYEELTVAVSEAGGLGAFPLPNFRTVEDLRSCLRNIRAKTDKPIGVNIHLSGKFPWKDQLALCLDAGVKFFLTSLGDPRLIIGDVHANGGKVFADVISLEQGLKARDRGVDGLVAVASDAGGHSGTTPTIVLVPYLRSKVGLPVVA
ncbi:MAG: nitronate monooxygenase, partial [Deltaproteobacteria bacterium]|nr:nitronate monooxygenase [Deltaproteobacteria bacterium]